MIGNSQRSGQTGRLYSEQVDQTGTAVRRRPLDDEVGARPIRRRRCYSDSRVIGLQRVVGKTGEEFAHAGVEGVGAAGIDLVVDRLARFVVGPEARLAGAVERDVDT